MPNWVQPSWVLKVGVALALSAVLLLPSSHLIFASDHRLVTVYYDGEERSVRTQAETVGEVLDQLEIELGEGDIAEPSVDSKIDLSVYHINIYRSRAVKVIDGDKEQLVLSAYRNPQLIAKEADIKVYPEDHIESYIVQDFTKEGFVGEKVIIDRATPIKLDFDNHTIEARTHKSTVKEVLAERDIKLRKQDFTKPGLDSTIKPGMEVRVVRVGTEVMTEESEIPFETRTIVDYNMPVGLSEVEKEGKPGREVKTFEVKRHNGREVSQELISRSVIEEPVQRVVKEGGQVSSNLTGNKESLMRQAGIPESSWSYVDLLVSKESGWNPNAQNPSSTAYGLGQFLNSTWGLVGCSKSSDPVHQLRCMHKYVTNVRGGWAAAWRHSQAYGWY